MIYSIGTLVTDWGQYDAMRTSFEAHGFGADDCEFLHIDNSAFNQADAYAGLNQFLNQAQGDYIILCHQDIRLLDDGRAKLDVELANLQKCDPTWALAGNAGGVNLGKLALRLTDPHGSNFNTEDLPAKVQTLDENFIVVKRESRVGFSHNLSGFHFYGADICLIADIMGYSAYVVDFHLEHLSRGKLSAEFYSSKSSFQRKWSRALRSRWLQTTCAVVAVSGSGITRIVGPLLATTVGKLRTAFRSLVKKVGVGASRDGE